MPQIQYLPVAGLKLDLHNYRIPPTANETKSVHALIAIKPHYFWDLTRSLLESGYDGTENIIVQETAKGERIVREGNRRVGAMRIIHGLLPTSKFEIPPDVEAGIAAVTAKWKTDNENVPCMVYPESEADVVNRLVNRTHGRGETAGRLVWDALARTRYERDVNKESEPALELLETYLKEATKISDDEREKWGGTFPITVLYEAMQKVATRYNLGGAANVLTEMDSNAALAKAMGRIIYDIGAGNLETRHMRPVTWGSEYGLPPAPAAASTTTTTTAASAGTAGSTGTPSTTATTAAAGAPSTPSTTGRGKTKDVSLNDHRSVKRALKKFTPRGAGSSKVVTLLEEAMELDVRETPICLCFLMRCMLDISVVAYFRKHKLQTFKSTPAGGKKDKTLAELLAEASRHLQAATTDKATISDLKTASAEINSSHSLLSVPIMNGLVHSGTATITEAHAISGFHKIFPLLVELNR